MLFVQLFIGLTWSCRTSGYSGGIGNGDHTRSEVFSEETRYESLSGTWEDADFVGVNGFEYF